MKNIRKLTSFVGFVYCIKIFITLTVFLFCKIPKHRRVVYLPRLKNKTKNSSKYTTH